ncbi:MAG TPA: hypothetical protein VG944_01540 [Fimbriimonas sp.]|nr:hypothetical protein [Fimbriimonas sp.]
MKKSLVSTTIGLTALSLTSGAIAATPTYTCIDLGQNYSPFAISPSSKYIAGSFQPALVSLGTQPFYMPLTVTNTVPPQVTVGTAVQFNNVLAPVSATSYSMNAWGVNDSGLIAGDCTYTDVMSSKNKAGYLVQAGATPTLVAFLLGDNSPAYAINNNSDVAGFDGASSRGYRWYNQATFYVRSPMSDGSSFDAINDKNYVAGSAMWSSGTWASFFDGAWHPIRISGSAPDPGVATGINHNDFVCGNDGSGATSKAWRWPNPKYLTYLGVQNQQPTQAYGINDKNYVVGSFGSNLYKLADGTTSTSHAFINYSGGTLTDLNNPAVTSGIPAGATLQAATAVTLRNSAKTDIVCTGVVATQNILGWTTTVHGYLLVQKN